MESYFSVSCPSLPFFLTSEKEKLIFVESMEAILSNTQSRSPLQWRRLIQHHDPNEGYVVSAVHHYKERHLMPNLQHEFIILFVEPRLPPDGLGPMAVPTILCVSRTITNHTLWARIGLWGPADDTVTVEGSVDQFHPGDAKLLHCLNFPYATAPSLRVVSTIISNVRIAMPRYYLIKTSCYSFALAVRRTIELIYNGVNGAQQQHDILVRESYLLHLIPTPTTRALESAWNIACVYLVIDGRDDGNMEM